MCSFEGGLEKVFLLKVQGGLGEVGGAAEVAPIVFVGAEGEDFFALSGEANVGVDDGEDSGFGEHGQEARGDDVDAGEGKGKWRVVCDEWRVDRLTRGGTATKLELIVEKEEAGGFPRLDCERGEGAAFVVKLEHAVKVDGANDVDVVEKEGFTDPYGGRRLIAV